MTNADPAPAMPKPRSRTRTVPAPRAASVSRELDRSAEGSRRPQGRRPRSARTSPTRSPPTTAGGFSPEERAMIANILRLREVRVDDVMVPRADIEAVEHRRRRSASCSTAFEKSGHSRMPVYRETLDDPLGLVHIKDLMSYITSRRAGRRRAGSPRQAASRGAGRPQARRPRRASCPRPISSATSCSCRRRCR